MKLQKKTAIVTGAGRGIGESYARGLYREGANVVIADVDKNAAERVAADINSKSSNGGKAVWVKVDVTSPEDTLKMAEAVISEFGAIDILVNNAGIFPLSTFEALSYEQWRKVLAVNLDGPFLCCKAVVPHMIKRAGGKIINISTECFFMGFGELVDYTAAKAGVIGLTRALAEALGKYNINVNAVTPGLTATAQLLHDQPGNFEPHIQGQCIKRRQEPEDIVGTIIFLSSADSDMITGQIINVDGGYNKH